MSFPHLRFPGSDRSERFSGTEHLASGVRRSAHSIQSVSVVIFWWARRQSPSWTSASVMSC